MIASYIFGSLLTLFVSYAAYRVLRCFKHGKNWPEDYPDGW